MSLGHLEGEWGGSMGGSLGAEGWVGGFFFGGAQPGPLLGGANERLAPHSRPP